MNPVTHFLAGWAVANAVPGLERRDRALVTLAGVVPDLDGLGAVAEIATLGSGRPLFWWSEYHHVLCHNLPFGLVLALAALAFGGRLSALSQTSLTAGRRRLLAAGAALAAFHVHLACDLAGGRGPDGYEWPIPYLWPVVRDRYVSWDGQWALNAWPNFALTGALLVLTLYLAWRRGFSPVEMVSARGDAAFVGALRRRFPRASGDSAPRRPGGSSSPGGGPP